jgi:hypothetical protein
MQATIWQLSNINIIESKNLSTTLKFSEIYRINLFFSFKTFIILNNRVILTNLYKRGSLATLTKL